MKTIIVAVVAITAILGMVLLFAATMTGMGGRGYDWDSQAVIGYGGYQRTDIIANVCEEAITAGNVGPGYTIPRTYKNAMNI